MLFKLIITTNKFWKKKNDRCRTDENRFGLFIDFSSLNNNNNDNIKVLTIIVTQFVVFATFFRLLNVYL